MNGIPDAPVIFSEINTTVVLAVFAVLACASVIYAIVLTIRESDPLPIAACIGALICALNEPIYDILGKIVYASNNPMAFTAFGREVPWFLVIGYVPWVGLLPVIIARMMADGVPRKKLHIIALVSFLSVVCVESLGTYFSAWAYYGDVPLKYLVVAPQMAPVPIVGGFLLYAISHKYKGWRRALSAAVISTLTLPMVFASASWPLYLGLYSDISPLVRWIAGIAMLGFTVAIVGATTGLAQRLYSGEKHGVSSNS
ncbi:hypothetical protein AGMMS49940_11670 [Spirochaetia bacterium]|nr:hypothetical protein AGMMS49940_11670 [Spirochaetia bacterium]